MVQVLQRLGWTGKPVSLGSMWSVSQGRRQAVCELWTAPPGWELRLLSGARLLQSQVCSVEAEVFDTADAWKDAMIAKGWR